MLFKMATFCSLDSTFKKISSSKDLVCEFFRVSFKTVSPIASYINRSFLRKEAFTAFSICALVLLNIGFSKSFSAEIAPTSILTAEDMVPTGPEKILLIPQWHLSPNQNTKISKKILPQAKNQNEIFKKLSSLIQKKELDALVVEGCEGDSLKDPTLKFNGWGLKDLNAKNSDKAQTHIAFRLLAKFPNVKIICGDSLVLIDKAQLALSDMRGLAGFKIRISSLSGAQQKPYVDAAIKTLKLSPDSSASAVVEELNKGIKMNSDLFNNTIKERNNSFVHSISRLKGRVAVVIGLLHLEDLQNQLASLKTAVEVWKPAGLSEGDK